MATDAARRARTGCGISWRVVLGFACHQAFVFSLFYLGSNRAIPLAGFAFERADLLAMLLCTVASLALVRLATDRARDALFSGSLPLLYAVLMALGSLVALPSGYGAAAYLVEGALVGLPGGIMLAAWGRALASRGASEVFLAVGAAALACLALALATAVAPLAPAALSLAPFGSAWALFGLVGEHAGRAKGSAGAPAADDDAAAGDDAGTAALATASISLADVVATREQRAETRRLSARAVAGTALFGVAAGFMETFSSDPGMASTPTFPATLLLLALFCIAALQLVAPAQAGEERAPESPDAVYRLSVLVMMAGFLFVPVLGAYGVPGDAIVLAGYLGLSAVLVRLFAIVANLSGLDPAATFARGFCALYLGEVGGIALGNLIDALGATGQDASAIAACAGLATLVAYLFLFTERDFRSLSAIVREVDRFGDACALIAREGGLSQREAEILPLALRGRTAERIAGELFIAKSTVETHLRRIYRKTGVHGRQELIDLGERTEARLASGAPAARLGEVGERRSDA